MTGHRGIEMVWEATMVGELSGTCEMNIVHWVEEGGREEGKERRTKHFR